MKVLRFLKLGAMIFAALFLIACGGGGGGGGTTESTPPSGNTAGIVYVKASNTGVGDLFGWKIAISADGNTMAIGAPGEFSSATDINGNQNDNSAPGSGAVYVFTRNNSSSPWSQQAYIKASNTEALENNDNFGASIDLSTDGNTLVVGAPGEDSSAIGTTGDQNNNSATDSGAVYVFTRTVIDENPPTWTQQAYVKPTNTGANDGFGTSVSLSGDGNTMAVGAIGEDSNGTSESNNSALGSGAVYVFTRNASTWSQQAYVKASNTKASNSNELEVDSFGISVALSADGNTLVIGASEEDSNGTSQSDISAPQSGAVYVFTRSGTNWNQQAYVKASNVEAGDNFGRSVALSADGNTMATGAPGKDSNSGAVYIFTRTENTWSQQAHVKASNTEADDGFGFSVALSSDGNTLAVGAPNESSIAAGIGGSQSDNSAPQSGAVYVFTRSASTWSQEKYAKASNTETLDVFGTSLALLGDGSTLAVGAPGEDSGATGIDGNQSDNSAPVSGAVYLY
jgi:hypothetical protein